MAVLVAGCASGNSSHPASNAEPVVLTGPTMSPRTLISTLASAGVATVANETSTAPQAPVTGGTALTVTSWQAGNMARETTAGAGITGADLDAMLPMPNAPSLAELLGAWVSAAADPAEVAAGRILGHRDWRDPATVVFPTAVLDLFVADAVAHAVGPAGATASPTASPTGSDTNEPTAALDRPAPNGGVSGSGVGGSEAGGSVVDAASVTSSPCSTIANFVNSVLTYVFNALKLDPAQVAAYVSGALGGGVVGAIAGGFAAWVASFWNAAVSAAQAAVEAILTALTQPVLNLLRIVIGGLATITMIASYLKRWTANVTPSPGANRFAVGSEPDRAGSFTVHIDPNAEITQWPQLFVDCASAAGVPLPTLSKAGLPITWQILGQEPGLVGITAPTGSPPTGALDDSLSGSLDYTTGRESVALAKKGTLVTPTVTATASVRRTEVEELRKFVTAFATAQLPRVLTPVLSPILASYVELATKQLDRITAVDGSATIIVSHHVPTPPTPSAAPANCTSNGTTIPAGHYAGPITATIKTKMTIDIPNGPNIVAGGGAFSVSGAVHLISDGTTVTGTITLAGAGGSEVGLAGSIKVNSKNHGSLRGRISGPATSPVVDGVISGSWKSLNAPLINSSGSGSNHLHAGLHVTQAGCTSITGDAVAMFRDIEAPVAQYLSVSGVGTWTAVRT